MNINAVSLSFASNNTRTQLMSQHRQFGSTTSLESFKRMHLPDAIKLMKKGELKLEAQPSIDEILRLYKQYGDFQNPAYALLKYGFLSHLDTSNMGQFQTLHNKEQGSAFIADALKHGFFNDINFDVQAIQDFKPEVIVSLVDNGYFNHMKNRFDLDSFGKICELSHVAARHLHMGGMINNLKGEFNIDFLNKHLYFNNSEETTLLVNLRATDFLENIEGQTSKYKKFQVQEN